MTVLQRLRARNFRNLVDLDLQPNAGVNWIEGDNAAGKTALLESIYCLSRSRSFRGRRFGSLVRSGTSEAAVEGWLAGEHLCQSVRWAAVSGGNFRRVGEGGLDRRLPTRLICESTHSLVEGEPALRRRFFDWNLCLRDPEAVGLFKNFARVSAQRNAWLKAGGRGRTVWDAPYVASLTAILQRRASFFEDLAQTLGELTRQEGLFVDVELRSSGLEGDSAGVFARLRESLPNDRERGYTYWGASRWDFGYLSDGKTWVGSRGEGKILGTLMQVAADMAVSRATGRGSIWLVDDIDAELSSGWSSRLVDLLLRRCGQMFITALPGKLDAARKQVDGGAVFHVERGRLRGRAGA